jgi:hypothetical protein
MLLRITAKHDRDESCNDYTLAREFTLADGVSTNDLSATIKRASQETIDLFYASYPHRGRAARTPFIDVSVTMAGVTISVPGLASAA